MKSRWSAVSELVVRRACALAVWGAASAAFAGYEVPNPAYAPPTHYYDTAAGTGTTLLNNLFTITSSGFTARTYYDSKWADGTGGSDSKGTHPGGFLDADPNNANNILLLYNRASVPGVWDQGTTWNREHIWPKYWLNLTSSQVSETYSGPASDFFELRPANPTINSTRNNYPYGYYPFVGSGGSAALNSGPGNSYWYPGAADTGDVARAIFYMATRYSTYVDTKNGGATVHLTLVNGNPDDTARYQMGDLNSLLHWNYSDGVDNFERRRNQLIYGSSGDLTNHALNPNYYQGNRNPYVDHPEYVWAVFGGGNNNSQIYVGGAPDADGSSATTVDLGHIIKGAAMPTGSTSVFKTGANPTTFDVTASNVTTAAGSPVPVGTGQPFDYNNVTRSISFTLASSTASVGVKSGSLTVNNTDLTTSGAGHGSADGNDTVNVTATVVDHSTGSLAAGSTVTSQAIDFGYVPQGFAPRTASFAVANRPAASGFTADLALNSVATSGSASFTTDAAPFAHLAAGSQNAYAATLDTATAGTLSAAHTFNVSDEAIPGATAGPGLGLNMTARVISSATFPATGFLQLNAGETYDTGPFSVAAGVTLTKSGPGAMNVTGPQSNGAGSTLAITGGGITLATDAGSSLAVSTAGAGTTLTISAAAQHLAGLTVGDNTAATVTAGGDKLLVARALTVASLGTLDLNDNDAIVTAPADAIRADLLAGRNGGAWTGTGITSTAAATDAHHATALAYAPGSILGGTFDGEPLDPAAVAIKYTWYGDANLDGRITGDDYALLDRGLAANLTGWTSGDFDYNGTIDAADYLLIDTSFGLQAGILSPAMLADREARFGDAYVAELIAAVPEPTTSGLAAAALLLATRRTRRA